MIRLYPLFLIAIICSAQDFNQRGFFEITTDLYPRTASNDDAHIIGAILLRYEASYKYGAHWRFAAAADARADTHRQVDRSLALTWRDRTLTEPSFALARASVLYTRGKLNVEAGKQPVRWGTVDLFNPMDRFSARDYMNPFQPDSLNPLAVRAIYGGSSNSVDLVYTPVPTPSRMPLLNQRWTVLPEGVPIFDAGAYFPQRGQYGARWSHSGSRDEFSLAFFDGYNNLPLIQAVLAPGSQPLLEASRVYPRLRTYGGDLVFPTRWATFKSEAAWFSSVRKQSDDYALYILETEKQTGEWLLSGGYAGEVVTAHRSLLDFNPERGLARAFFGRADYAISSDRTLGAKTVLRQNGRASWTQLSYSQLFAQHFRVTAAYNWLRGSSEDFIGQFYRNSFVTVTLRYSF